MKKLLITTFVAFTSTTAMAGFQNNGSNQQMGGFSGGNAPSTAMVKTIAQAQKAWEDTPVTLTGKITRQVDHDEFFFKDSTGEIKIDVEDYAWQGQTITPNSNITIQGVVDRNDWGGADIDVYSVKKH